MLLHRRLSVRGFSPDHLMRAAVVIEGTSRDATVRQLLAEPKIEYLQIYNAGPGCWNCRVGRD